MLTDLAAHARRFCRALGDDTGRKPMQWRAAILIGARCSLHSPEEFERILAYAEEAGWLEIEGRHSVCLTDAGRRL